MAICDELLALDDPSDGTIEELVERYRDARALAKQFTEIATDIESELVARMETDRVTVPHVGWLRRVPTKRSEWRDERSAEDFRHAIAETVVREIALDLATGEVDPVKRNIARATINEMYDIIPSFSDVKARGRRLGIDVSDFRSYSTVMKVEFDPEGDMP